MGCFAERSILCQIEIAVRGRNLLLPTGHAMLRVPIITGGCGVISLLILKFRTWHCVGTFGAIT